MKVILSRKGMDSQYGGIPSPIIRSELGYWKYYSLPIPSNNSQIKYDDIYLFDNIPVSKFIHDVAPNYKQSKYCHLDPDIRESTLKNRPKEWKRSFGQVKQAQAHLENNGIDKGDVFLFFGWFQFAELKNGKFKYISNTDYPNGFHAIYGYLQIDKIIKPNISSSPKWLDYHPHVKYKDREEFKSPNNTIYISDNLFKYPIHFNKNGSVMFAFSDDLILTKKGQNNRTIWQLPKNLHPNNGIELTYNPSNNWTIEGEYSILKSASRGQEFIFKDVQGIVEKWCIETIRMHTVTD